MRSLLLASPFFFAAVALSSGHAQAADTSPPTVPQDISAYQIILAPGEIGPSVEPGLYVSWSPSTDDVGVAGYLVFRRDDASPGSGFESLADVTDTTYQDSSPPFGEYSFIVRAYDAAGNISADSDIASVTISENDPYNPKSIADDSGCRGDDASLFLLLPLLALLYRKNFSIKLKAGLLSC